MATLVKIPGDLARARPGREHYARLLGTEELVEALRHWKEFVVAQGGDDAGYIAVNSCYRPKSDLTPDGPWGGKPEPGVKKHDYYVDYTDANGHWTGCAIDHSTRLTADSFWHDISYENEMGVGAAYKWRRDDIRSSLVAVGLYFPWYWVDGIVGGGILEYWHCGIELIPWTQQLAYRGALPPWYAGLRPNSRAICTS